MARQRNYGRQCKFESLETRRLLAGDVTASITRGKLSIEGDGLSNGITITPGPAATFSVVITGVNAGGSATRVNGVPNAPVTLPGFTGGMNVDMGDGNDITTISNLTVHGKATVESGKGIDTVSVSGSTFNSSVKLKPGKNDDTVTVANTTVLGNTKIKASTGSDKVTITSSALSKLKVSLGKGNDTLTIASTTVSTKTVLNGGSGSNTFINAADNRLVNISKKNFIL